MKGGRGGEREGGGSGGGERGGGAVEPVEGGRRRGPCVPVEQDEMRGFLEKRRIGRTRAYGFCFPRAFVVHHRWRKRTRETSRNWLAIDTHPPLRLGIACPVAHAVLGRSRTEPI